MYLVKRPAISQFVPVRQAQYHFLQWGNADSSQRPLIMVHGWMDVAASYQFMVDCLSESFLSERKIIAPDWRGFGLSSTGGVDNYWLDDYLADLEFFLEQVAPGQTIDLIGHSMGGNIAMHYCGVMPEKVHQLINLEGFGGPAAKASQAPTKKSKWLKEMHAMYKGEIQLRPYATADAVAQRLMKTNPRLANTDQGRHKAQWLAQQWAQANSNNQWDILADIAHKISGSEITREDEVLATYAQITAPVLAVQASDNSLEQWWGKHYTLDQYFERLKSVANCQTLTLPDCGHMLHHDQPELLARAIEEFLNGDLVSK